jgi:hypothetical protein
VSRRISSPELIGRAAELSSLHAALDDARAGQGRVVLVEGDAGLGKARLVEHFTSTATGVRVLAGGGIPLATEPGGYINFMQDDDYGRIRDSYRQNYDRLVQVKRAHDPGNLSI